MGGGASLLALRAVGFTDQLGGYFATDNVRSMPLVFPCLSFTDTVSLPFARSLIGVARASSQTPSDLALSLLARLVPAAAPSTAKSAVTSRLLASRPVA